VLLFAMARDRPRSRSPPRLNPPTPRPLNSGSRRRDVLPAAAGRTERARSEPAPVIALILDAARKTNDPALYQRAVEIAFQSRAGDAALQAARAWKQAFPQSREANRFVLQILLALNRVPRGAEPLRTEIALADARSAMPP
jgi:hypothetical protein